MPVRAEPLSPVACYRYIYTHLCTFIHICIHLYTLKYTAAQLSITSTPTWVLLSRTGLCPWFVELYHRGCFWLLCSSAHSNGCFFQLQEGKSISGKASECSKDGTHFPGRSNHSKAG